MEGTCFIESMIQQAEFENKLFESMLQISFRKAQVLKEADTSEQTDPDDGPDVNPAPAQADQDTADEETKKKWYQKLGEILKNLLNAVINAITNFINAVKEKIISNNAIVDKFKDALTKPHALQGFPGIENFAAPDINNDKGCIEIIKMYNELVNLFKEGTWFDSSMENKTKEIEDASKSVLLKPVELWNKSGSANFDWNKAVSELNTAANGQSLFGKTLNELRKVAAAPDSLMMKIKNLGTKDDVYEQNNAEAKKAFSNIREASSYMLNANKAYIKALRHAIFTCGTYALKAAKGEAGEKATEEQNVAAEAMSWYVGVQSDQFIDEAFAFI